MSNNQNTNDQNAKRRVVVTGMGMVSPLGLDVATSWQAALKGESGVKPISHFDASEYRAQIAATVAGFQASDYMPAKEARRYDPFIQYGMAASVQAIAQSGLESFAGLDKTRVGVCIGSGIGGLSLIESNCATLLEKGARRVSPFFVPASIVNMTAGLVAIRFGFQGANLAIATACTTSTHTVGMAARLIAYGDTDVMVAGGSEKASTPLGIAGFSAMQALSTRNDEPTKASRPFDADRDGFVLGDGAGVLVLESLAHAQNRGARILAELVGFGMSDDASHITAPPENGAGAALAMQHTLKDAGISAAQVGYVNAHGTSTPLGDIAESQAISNVFAGSADKVAVSSTKSMTGHLLGAAGGVEAIMTIQALQDQMLPPTINLDNADAACQLDYVPNQARSTSIDYAMSNSFGFGGTNGSLIFRRFNT